MLGALLGLQGRETPFLHESLPELLFAHRLQHVLELFVFLLSLDKHLVQFLLLHDVQGLLVLPGLALFKGGAAVGEHLGPVCLFVHDAVVGQHVESAVHPLEHLGVVVVTLAVKEVPDLVEVVTPGLQSV